MCRSTRTAYGHACCLQAAECSCCPVQVGLKILQDNEKVFACYESMWDTIYHSEVGASKAVLDAGFTLDSLMLRYKGVDWRNQSNWGCNGECVPPALLCCKVAAVLCYE